MAPTSGGRGKTLRSVRGRGLTPLTLARAPARSSLRANQIQWGVIAEIRSLR